MELGRIDYVNVLQDARAAPATIEFGELCNFTLKIQEILGVSSRYQTIKNGRWISNGECQIQTIRNAVYKLEMITHLSCVFIKIFYFKIFIVVHTISYKCSPQFVKKIDARAVHDDRNSSPCILFFNILYVCWKWYCYRLCNVLR